MSGRRQKRAVAVKKTSDTELMDLAPAAHASARAAIGEEYGHVGWGTPEVTDEIIALGWRRWRSYERRHAKGKGTFEERVQDLAKGLCSQLQPAEYPLGADMVENRWLASTLGRIFAESAADSWTN